MRRRIRKENAGRGPLAEITIWMYTREGWFTCFPWSSETLWEICGCENAVNLATALALTRLGSEKNLLFTGRTAVRVVTLDEEYGKWLAENGRRESETSRQEYIASIRDSDAERLWNKNRMGNVYHGCALLCSCPWEELPANRRTAYRLNRKQQERLRLCLERIFGSGAVWVSPQFVTPGDFMKAAGEFREEGRVWLKEGKTFSRLRYNEQYLEEGESGALLCLPVTVSCHFPWRFFLWEMFDDEENVRALPTHCHLANREEFRTIREILRECTGCHTLTLHPALIRPGAALDAGACFTERHPGEAKGKRRFLLRKHKGNRL